MKKIKFLIFSLSLLTMSLNSCKDAYDIVQDGELSSDTVFRTTSDLKSYLLGSVYTSLDNTNQIAFTSYFTDEAKVDPDNSGWYFDQHRYIITPGDSFATAIWLNNYVLINRVNTLLQKAETIQPESGEESEYNNILAQARVLRAYAYLQLESFFTTDMKDDSALGVILSTQVEDMYAKLPRSTNGEVWNQVISDLDYGYSNLNSSESSTQYTPYFVTKTVVNAIRARVYLYKGDYTNAKKYAEDVIDKSGLSLTQASPFDSADFWDFKKTDLESPYIRMWGDLDTYGANVKSNEIIFAFSRPIGGTGGNIANAWATNSTDIGGSLFYGVGMNLFSVMDSYDDDIRIYNLIDNSSDFDNNRLVIDKYPGKGSAVLKNDLKAFRLSEMYLILAECQARESNWSGVSTSLKAIRDARNINGEAELPTITSLKNALQEILKERRVELCFEGHRYIDLRRLGKEAGVSIDRSTLDDIIATPTTLDINDYRWTLPIPASELNGNSSIEQNPNY